jgi:branched-chain amino acid transport system ATP-binding protein/neutral amino acid transport system ATP-binding protein
MLKVKNLKKYYGGIKAVDNCSFEIKKNKITGLIGPNGAGKSTLFNLISGFEKQESGDIYFNSKNISKKDPDTISNLGISRVFQKSRLFDNLTVFENLRVSIEEDNQDFFKSLVSSNKISKSEIKQINDVMQLLNISHIKNKSCSELSFGQKRLVELARAILKPHSLLILDEPVAGVQPKIRNKIMDIIKVLKKKGKTILLIEHDMFFTFKTCDEIIVLEKGKNIAKGTPKQIKNNQKVLDAYLGD